MNHVLSNASIHIGLNESSSIQFTNMLTQPSLEVDCQRVPIINMQYTPWLNDTQPDQFSTW